MSRLPWRTAAPLSLTHDAYERLRAQLLACRFPAGARLTIAELCRTFSVSQGAVREALSRLTAEGLVESRPQQGFRVTPTSAADVWALTTARCDVEALCLARSIVLGNLAWEGRILAAYHQLSRTPQVDPKDKKHYSPAFIAAHGEFLDSLVSACDNPGFIQEFTPSGSTYTAGVTFGNNVLVGPEGLALDPSQNLYVSNSVDTQVVEFQYNP